MRRNIGSSSPSAYCMTRTSIGPDWCFRPTHTPSHIDCMVCYFSSFFADTCTAGLCTADGGWCHTCATTLPDHGELEYSIVVKVDSLWLEGRNMPQCLEITLVVSCGVGITEWGPFERPECPPMPATVMILGNFVRYCIFARHAPT